MVRATADVMLVGGRDGLGTIHRRIGRDGRMGCITACLLGIGLAGEELAIDFEQSLHLFLHDMLLYCSVVTITALFMVSNHCYISQEPRKAKLRPLMTSSEARMISLGKVQSLASGSEASLLTIRG
jgi:hypothetical protein